MNRYRHFDDEFDSDHRNSAAILPENDPDEPFSFESNIQVHNYPSKWTKFKIYFFQRTYLERFLFFLIFIFLIVLFLTIIISLYNQKQNSLQSLCLTPACIEVSHSLFSAMNQSADPCEDFYEFTCGHWIRTNIIPKSYSSWSILRELSHKNLILLKNLLEQTSISSLNNPEQETIKYYQSCMNVTELERLDNQPLEKYFENTLNFTLKQWIDIDQNQTWEKLFISLSKIFLYILPIKISPDEKNSSWYNIYIDQPQIGLGNRGYYINSSTDNQTNTRNKIIRDAYSKVGSDILQLLGFEKNDSVKRMNDIIQFETELAIASLPREMLQKHDETYHLMSLKQLQEEYQAIGFDILTYFNDLFHLNPIKFNENDQIIVLTYEHMLNISNILTNYLLIPNKSHIVIDYFLFSFVFGITSHLPSIYDKTRLPLSKELFGTDSIPERWEYCVRRTDDAFGYALGGLYIKSAFGETDRLEAKKLIKNIREIFEENLDKLQWIDKQSKIEAKKKLEKMNEKIGYPDFIKNLTKLNEYYDGSPMIENAFFDNEIKIKNRDGQQALLKFRQKVDRTEWSMSPPTVNAYYSASFNEIVFPAGILQPPFFHKDLPIAVNYGAIGMVIGHEMTHGFDNIGRVFDADGNMRSWWTNFSVENFQEKSKCFIEQYSKFSLDGQNENGQITLGENLADNGGLKLAYSAYQKQKKHLFNSANNRRLPGLNYNNDQLFFIAFAHNWCNIETSNAMHYDLSNDVHSLGRLRITGIVQNSEEFSKVFSCKSKTSMNPNTKCQLW